MAITASDDEFVIGIRTVGGFRTGFFDLRSRGTVGYVMSLKDFYGKTENQDSQAATGFQRPEFSRTCGSRSQCKTTFTCLPCRGR